MSQDLLKPKGKHKNTNQGFRERERAIRRKEAEVRQAEYNRLTFEQKLAKAGTKQKAKLLARQNRTGATK